ncbi:MAG TPA: lasso peptide [Xenococcaceae cyanobacterium]
MKKKYVQPQLYIHGSVEQLTQIAGNSGSGDTLFFNGVATGFESNDSRDVNCTANGCDPV